MLGSKKSIVVWDHPESPPTDRLVLLWNGYTENKSHRSILKTLEENSDVLRSDYLTFIRDLGQIRVRDKKIVEHLMIEKGLSLWWMSLLAEKGTLKTKAPLNCLRLLALNLLLVEIKPHSVELISKNKLLGQSLSQLCASLDISFKWSKPFKNSDQFNIQYLWEKLPRVTQVPIFLVRHLYLHWPLSKSLDTNWFQGDDAFPLFSYFLNLDRDALNKGKFLSKYWETLPELIKRSGKNTNWIHHFMVSIDVPDTKTGIKYLKAFNEDAKNQGHHNFLYSFLTFATVAKAIAMWFRISLNAALIQRALEKYMLGHPKGWLWPLIREDWNRSVYGVVAIENTLWVQLFERAMSSLPKQNLGLYLCENQGWERAFIHYWKKYDHGRLIAVAHSTVRYWDLRYFDDPQVWQSKDALAQPLPEKIALNGPAAFRAYRGANQPKDRLVEVEALRYQHLNLLKRKSNSFGSNSDQKTLLILGDYVSKTTHQMLRLLDCLEQSALVKYEIIFRPHPATQISLLHYKKLNLRETATSLDKLIPKADVVLSTENTSAVVEPFIAGLPVIVAIENDNFNFSPLRGEHGVCFIRTSEDLKKALENLGSAPFKDSQNNFFWTDPELPRWKVLLGLVQKQTA